MDFDGLTGHIIGVVGGLVFVAGVYALSQHIGRPEPENAVRPAEIQQPEKMYQRRSADRIEEQDAALDAGTYNHNY